MNRYLSQVIKNFDTKKNDVFCEWVSDASIESITWGKLEHSCRQFIGTLDCLLSGKGAVLIFLPHSVELFPAFVGCMLGGYTPSFMPCASPRQDSQLYWKSHQELLNSIKPVAVITNKEVEREMVAAGLDLDVTTVCLVEELHHELGDFISRADDEIAFLQHSSGTTGLKKGVELSFGAIYKHAQSYGKTIALSEQDVIVSWLPTYHDMGLIACMITPLFHGVKTVQMSAFEWLGRPHKLFKLIEEYKATLCWLPNFAFDHMSNTVGKHAAKFDLTSIRAFISCSEPCKASTFQRFSTTFKKSGVNQSQLHCCYAMAETVFAVTQTDLCSSNRLPTYRRLRVDARKLNRGDLIALSDNPEHSQQLLSCGKVTDGLSIRILDVDGRKLEAGHIGEISISGEYLFSGYRDDPEQTGKVLHAGQYKTNDLGFLHKGELFVLGRNDDLIIINGRNLYAHQIEDLVGKVEGAKPGRAAAISVFDDKAGSETLIVLVEKIKNSVLDDRQLAEQITKAIQAELNVVPRSVDIVKLGSLIKTSSGKVSRKENHARYVASNEMHSYSKAA